jgi:hypothetical protein
VLKHCAMTTYCTVERNFFLSFMINICIFIIVTLVVLTRVGIKTFGNVMVKSGEQKYLTKVFAVRISN